jgi:hypothetical protein
MRADEVLIIDGNKKFEAEAVRKPSGHIIIAGNVVADTVQCKHCGGHFIPIKGSGIKRGWCTHCGGALCGREECMECKDFRKKMDEYEAGILKILR